MSSVPPSPPSPPSPPTPPGPAGTPAAPDPYGDLLDAPPCPRHPRREARLRCASCNTRMCVECGAVFEERRLCDACLAPRAVAEEAKRNAPEVIRRRARFGGMGFVLVVMILLGLCYLLLFPSIQAAKRRAAVRAQSTILTRVFDAARLYSHDNKGILPTPEDRRISTLAKDMQRLDYLRRIPLNLVEGRIVTESARYAADPWAIYAVEDEPHRSPDDDAPSHWVLTTGGQVHELDVTVTARALRDGTVYGHVTGTALPWMTTVFGISPTPTAAPRATSATATPAIVVPPAASATAVPSGASPTALPRSGDEED